MKSLKEILVFTYLEAQALKRKLSLRFFADQEPFKHIKADVSIQKKWLGTVYGGFFAHLPAIKKGAVVLSIGIGKDISFDRALLKHVPCKVHGYDPTPKSIDWIKTQNLPSGFSFFPVGITAGSSGTYKFLLPANPRQVSGVIGDDGPTERTIAVELLNLKDILAKLELTHIDVLKMDIEGAEYEVLSEILDMNIPIGQILVEFHDRNFETAEPRSKPLVENLRKHGYLIFGVSLSSEEVSFIHKSKLP
jgi:FkbM family methyltransferase